jgi:hypothetical protein
MTTADYIPDVAPLPGDQTKKLSHGARDTSQLVADH